MVSQRFFACCLAAIYSKRKGPQTFSIFHFYLRTCVYRGGEEEKFSDTAKRSIQTKDSNVNKWQQQYSNGIAQTWSQSLCGSGSLAGQFQLILPIWLCVLIPLFNLSSWIKKLLHLLSKEISTLCLASGSSRETAFPYLKSLNELQEKLTGKKKVEWYKTKIVLVHNIETLFQPFTSAHSVRHQMCCLQ